METVFLARHAESRLGSRGLANGDPAACEGLTEAGRDQARALGRRLAAEPLELCVHTDFRRARETADLALAGRAVPRLLVPELGDIRVGSFEGLPLSEYLAWAWSAGPEEECPGGGESRAAVARRYAEGFRAVLARPERTALVVAHGLPIRYALEAADGRNPGARAAVVEHARPHRLASADLARAVDRLEDWCRSPAFA